MRGRLALKYIGDVVEKLMVGALIIGLFEDKVAAIVSGFTLLGFLAIVRVLEISKEERRNPK